MVIPRGGGSDKCDAIAMDSLINAAAQALAAGNPFAALNRVALREDAPALALRGIAMAQIGNLERARTLLRQAARAFGPRAAVPRARCIVAEAEIALVSRDLGWRPRALETAAATLERHGDRLNATYAKQLQVRRLLLLRRLDEAERLLGRLDPTVLTPAGRAAHEMAAAGIALRRLRTGAARAALARAGRAAREAAIPALMAEAESAAAVLEEPAARLIARGEERLLLLDEVEALLASGTLVADACRRVARQGDSMVPLAMRPVLFALLRALAEAWPGDVSRLHLVRQAFHAREADESHRARLRVEMGRLRRALGGLARLTATGDGFRLVPCRPVGVVVLAPPVEEPHGTVRALLADGEAWSSSALALALGVSPRTVQRALGELAAAGQVRSVGRGPARRWTAPPLPGIPTVLLLPGPLPMD